MSEELISRSAAIDIVRNAKCKYPTWPHIVEAKEQMITAIEQAPTVPAEIVVHCRNCRKRNTPRCNMTHNMGGGRFLTCNEDLGYCNLAEMKHIEINKGEENK